MKSKFKFIHRLFRASRCSILDLIRLILQVAYGYLEPCTMAGFNSMVELLQVDGFFLIFVIQGRNDATLVSRHVLILVVQVKVD